MAGPVIRLAVNRIHSLLMLQLLLAGILHFSLLMISSLSQDMIFEKPWPSYCQVLGLFSKSFPFVQSLIKIPVFFSDGHPVVCKDELEVWMPHESSLFEEALNKYTKVFPDIITDFLPWKSPKSIVEMYYFWKTTDRYTSHRKNKMALKDQKLKQVYIPDYSKPNSSVLYNRTDGNDRGCECCYGEPSLY